MSDTKTITATIDEIVEAIKKQRQIITDLSDESVMCLTGNNIRTALEGLVVNKFETNIKCDCGNPLTEKELYFETCLKCDNFQPCDTTPTEKGETT